MNVSAIDSLYEIEDYNKIIDLNKSNFKFKDSLKQAKIHTIFAKSFENLNKEDSALFYYKKALRTFKSINESELVARTNLAIYTLLDSQNSLESEKDIYLEAIKNHAVATKSKKWLASYYSNYGVKLYKKKFPKSLEFRNDSIKIHTDSAKYYYNTALEYAEAIDSNSLKINLYLNIGALYSNRYGKQDSAIYFYDNALKSYHNDTLNNKNLNSEFNLYNNIGNAYRRKKDFNTALTYYTKAENIELPKLNRKSKKIL